MGFAQIKAMEAEKNRLVQTVDTVDIEIKTAFVAFGKFTVSDNTVTIVMLNVQQPYALSLWTTRDKQTVCLVWAKCQLPLLR